MGVSLRPYLVDLAVLRSRFAEASSRTSPEVQADLLEQLCETVGTAADAPLFNATSWPFVLDVFAGLSGCGVLLEARPPVELPAAAVSPLVSHLTAEEAAAAAAANEEEESSPADRSMKLGQAEVREWLDAAAERSLAIVTFCT